jgi:non-heme chloroperoxidase
LPASQKQTRTFDAAQGLRLTADCYGDPEAPAVLLFHGGGQTRHAFGGTATALAHAGWYAVSFDLRGHGDSDWSEAGRYHFADYASDVVAVASGFESPVLVGASLGGIASLRAIAETGSEPNASALVLVDIATRMERAGTERIRSFMTSRPEGFESLEEAADLIAAYNPHRKRPRNLAGLEKNLRLGADGRYRWHWDPRFMQIRSLDHALSDVASLDEAARGLAMPVLLVRGRMSDLLSEEGARHFLDLVPHAHFRDVSGAGHMIAGDRNDLFTEAVTTFLASEVRRDARAS